MKCDQIITYHIDITAIDSFGTKTRKSVPSQFKRDWHISVAFSLLKGKDQVLTSLCESRQVSTRMDLSSQVNLLRNARLLSSDILPLERGRKSKEKASEIQFYGDTFSPSPLLPDRSWLDKYTRRNFTENSIEEDNETVLVDFEDMLEAPEAPPQPPQPPKRPELPGQQSNKKYKRKRKKPLQLTKPVVVGSGKSQSGSYGTYYYEKPLYESGGTAKEMSTLERLAKIMELLGGIWSGYFGYSGFIL